MKTIKTEWYLQNCCIATQIGCVVDKKDVDARPQSLEMALTREDSDRTMISFASQHDYRADNFEMRQKWHANMPGNGTPFSWRPDGLDSYAEAKIGLCNTRCMRGEIFLYVHTDEARPADNAISYRRPNRQYYIKPTPGEPGIRKYQNENNSL